MAQPPLWYWLEPANAPHRFEHRFCGPAPPHAAPCPNCRAPLLLYADFDARDPRLGLAELGTARVPCLFCWRCALAQHTLVYRLSADGGAEIVVCGRGPVEVDFPYADYPPSFPAAALALEVPTGRELVALERIRNGTQWHELDEDLRRLVVPRHRAGVELPWESPPSCALCSRPTRAFATFGDRNLDPRGFAGNECLEVHFSACARCATIAATQSSD